MSELPLHLTDPAVWTLRTKPHIYRRNGQWRADVRSCYARMPYGAVIRLRFWLMERNCQTHWCDDEHGVPIDLPRDEPLQPVRDVRERWRDSDGFAEPLWKRKQTAAAHVAIGEAVQQAYDKARGPRDA